MSETKMAKTSPKLTHTHTRAALRSFLLSVMPFCVSFLYCSSFLSFALGA